MNLVRRSWAAIIETAKSIAALSAALGLVGTFVWYLAEPRIAPYVSLPEEVIALSLKIDRNFDDQGRAISRIQSDVNELKSNPVIVEYDKLRSRIVEPFCTNGQVCTAELVVRRTKQGDLCGKPLGQRFVRNHNGIVRPANKPWETSGTRIGTDWITLSIKFIVPEGSRQGRAEFFMALEYPDCPFAPEDAVVKENSIPLEFEIVGSPNSTLQLTK